MPSVPRRSSQRLLPGLGSSRSGVGFVRAGVSIRTNRPKVSGPADPGRSCTSTSPSSSSWTEPRPTIHAVIDNFSRRILAWKLMPRLEPLTTCLVLLEAAKELGPMLDPANPATVMADSGVENVNSQVDELLGLRPLRRVLAQVEVAYSNSLIEAWWRSLKYGWLFLHHLHSFAALEKLIAWYVGEHNAVIPHSAFRGQTPDEMFFGRGDGIPDELDAARRQARVARLEAQLFASASGRNPYDFSTRPRSDWIRISGQGIRIGCCPECWAHSRTSDGQVDCRHCAAGTRFSTRPQAATERSPSDSRPQFSHDSDRLALRRASSAADLADASSAGTCSPVLKYISSGVCPRKAECGTCVL
jgi:hypothetical protein